ncbi:hypothetical protein N7481_002903 [Penicillium waksmanii]|uniref:uncharacterized protein n=1 Tax=Penicillium waksmanii TaxID=69791 RepID=UPI0025493C5F|nr:uncharacterized protein N7481_002903 [Penicillium waksmanii]KAJ5987693.1 hypothetical protein N7481_002903 [Penicillium waksmanii]
MPVPRVDQAGLRLSGGVPAALKKLPSNRERVQNVNRSATELLMELNSSPKAQVKPDRVRELLENELQALRKDLSKEIHDAVKAATEPPSRMGTASWARAAAQAPAPAHQLSLPLSSNATSAAPITARDRDVIVCLNNRDQVDRYCGKPSEEMKDYANKVRAEYAKDTRTATLATVMVKAVCQLKSGDLRLTVRDAREAQVMRLHRDIWVKGFGSTAFALREAQGAIAIAMWAENSRYWGKDATITKINWLRAPKEGAKLASVILEFSKPQSANKAIEEGVLWDSNRYQALLYDRSLRVRQCFNCQQYGHIGTSCANKTKCVYCAGEHQSRDCTTRMHEGKERKCANCEGAHPAWSEDCEVRIAMVEKVMAMAMQRGRFHPVPAEFSYHDPSVSLAPSSLSSMGTPQVSSTEGSNDTTGSAVVSAARSSNGEQSTSANRTSSGIQGKPARRTVAKAPFTQAKKAQKAKRATVEDTMEGVQQEAPQEIPQEVPEAQQDAQQGVPEAQEAPRAASPSGNIQPISFTTTTQEPFVSSTPALFNATARDIDFQPSTTDAAAGAATETGAGADTGSKGSRKEEVGWRRTAKAREALAKKRKERSQYSDPAQKKADRRSARFVSQLEQANQESEGSEEAAGEEAAEGDAAEEATEADLPEVDLSVMEEQLNRDRARSESDFQPSSVPEMATRGQKRKQPASERSYRMRINRKTTRKATTTTPTERE